MELEFSTDSGWVDWWIGWLGRRQRLEHNVIKLLTTELETLETSIDTVST